MQTQNNEAPPASLPGTHPIRRRCVFYLSGFDPRGARHYHALYKTQSQLRPKDSETTLSVTSRKKDTDGIGWEAEATNGELTTTTSFKFLAWDDIVRSQWPKGRLRHWIEYLKGSRVYLTSGFFKRYWEISNRLQILSNAAAGLLHFPNKLIALTILGIVASAIATFWATSVATGQAWLGALLCLIPPWIIWESAHRFEETRDLGWIMRSYAFTARQSQGLVTELDARLDDFAQQVIERVRANVDDEILIVGHSSGSIIAASVMARAVEAAPDLLQHRTQIGLITLGQCIPMLALLPGATGFRHELRSLGRTAGLMWVDISAPADRCCVAMIDPVSACAEELTEDERGLTFLAVNPQFHELFEENEYEALKKNAFQMHFQYLYAPPALGDFDYFEISGGTLSLRERFTPRILAPLPKDFDPECYLRLNPDIAKMGIDAERHYQWHGAKESRKYKLELPDDFDPEVYLELNPDVASAGLEAEVHYLNHGKAEERRYRT